jgi:hypothetical protein
MTPLNVVFDLPAALANGLQNGAYERLREGGNGVVSQPPLPKPPLGEAAQLITPMLSAVNLGVSVAGFAVVITQLNQISDQIRLIEAKVDRVSVKLDDQALAKLKAGVNACLNAVELGDANLRQQMAGQALTTLHEARQYLNQQVLRSAAKAEATSAE